jgi:hypothetical protein
MSTLANRGHAISDQSFMLRLREALEAGWDAQTSYEAAEQTGKLALGQCYPTSRVVQHYYPATEIIKGKVWTGKTAEIHFWNGLLINEHWHHIDLSWQQFPAGSIIQQFVVLDRQHLGDSETAVQRCALLLRRVKAYLAKTVPAAAVLSIS